MAEKSMRSKQKTGSFGKIGIEKRTDGRKKGWKRGWKRGVRRICDMLIYHIR